MELDEFIFEPIDANRLTAVGYTPTQNDVAKAVVLIYRIAEYVHDLAEEMRNVSRWDKQQLDKFESALEAAKLIDPRGRVVATPRLAEVIPQAPAAHTPVFTQPAAQVVEVCVCPIAVKEKDGPQTCLLCGKNAYASTYAFSHTPEGLQLLDHTRDVGGVINAVKDGVLTQTTNLLPFPGQGQPAESSDESDDGGECEIETEPPPYEHELIEAIQGAANLPLNMVPATPCSCNPSPLAGGDDHGVDGEYCPVCGGV